MKLRPYFILFFLLIAGLLSCKKVQYRKIDNPAYIRVFNNLTYTIGASNKEEPQPFLCMLIDPVMDAQGKPSGAAIVGDFLDKRNAYASPNPAHVGTGTSRFNPEYPGKELVLTAPILNGFDLTNWAQVPSGKHRIMFISRPINEVPFFELEARLRENIMVDTTINLTEREVYTLHVLQKDFKTKQNGLYIRQESFYKQAFSDSLSYVNFYNLSAKGFWNADHGTKNISSSRLYVPLSYGLKDDMNVYITQISATNQQIPGFAYQFAGRMKRTTDHPEVTPYFAFPIFSEVKDNGIFTGSWQFVQFTVPGEDPKLNNMFAPPPSTVVYGAVSNVNGDYGYAQFDTKRYPSSFLDIFPNMIVNVHSGVNNPRSFGVVNSVEVVNGNVYLTTVQRKYAAPVY